MTGARIACLSALKFGSDPLLMKFTGDLRFSTIVGIKDAQTIKDLIA
jgi:hypothetical protein